MKASLSFVAILSVTSTVAATTLFVGDEQNHAILPIQVEFNSSQNVFSYQELNSVLLPASIEPQAVVTGATTGYVAGTGTTLAFYFDLTALSPGASGVISTSASTSVLDIAVSEDFLCFSTKSAGGSYEILVYNPTTQTLVETITSGPSGAIALNGSNLYATQTSSGLPFAACYQLPATTPTPFTFTTESSTATIQEITFGASGSTELAYLLGSNMVSGTATLPGFAFYETNLDERTIFSSFPELPPSDVTSDLEIFSANQDGDTLFFVTSATGQSYLYAITPSIGVSSLGIVPFTFSVIPHGVASDNQFFYILTSSPQESNILAIGNTTRLLAGVIPLTKRSYTGLASYESL